MASALAKLMSLQGGRPCLCCLGRTIGLKKPRAMFVCVLQMGSRIYQHWYISIVSCSSSDVAVAKPASRPITVIPNRLSTISEHKNDATPKSKSKSKFKLKDVREEEGGPEPTGRVSPRRTFPKYRKHDLGGGRPSWMIKLNLQPTDLDTLIQDIEWFIVELGLEGKFFTGTEGGNLVKGLAKQLMYRRPDIFPPDHLVMTKKRGMQVIRLMASRVKSDMKSGQLYGPDGKIRPTRPSDSDQAEQSQSHRPIDTTSSLFGTEDSSSEGADEDEDYTQERHVPRVTDRSRVERARDWENARSDAPTSTNAQPQLTSRVSAPVPQSNTAAAFRPYSQGLDQNDITIDIFHHTYAGEVATVRLDEIFDTKREEFDIHNGRGLYFDRLLSKLTYYKRFRVNEQYFSEKNDELWCEVEGSDRIIHNQVEFENACSRCIAASLRAYPTHQPTITMSMRQREFRDVPEDIAVSRIDEATTRTSDGFLKPAKPSKLLPDARSVRTEGASDQRTGHRAHRISSKRPWELTTGSERKRKTMRTEESIERTSQAHDSEWASPEQAESITVQPSDRLSSTDEPRRHGYGSPLMVTPKSREDSVRLLRDQVKGKQPMPALPSSRNSPTSNAFARDGYTDRHAGERILSTSTDYGSSIPDPVRQQYYEFPQRR